MPNIHDIEFEKFTYDSVSVDRSNLNQEFCRVASDLAYWGEQLARAEGAVSEAKADLESTRANLYQSCRAQLEAKAAVDRGINNKSTAKVTEGMVDAAVVTSAAYNSVQAHLRECEVERIRVRTVIESVKTKREMIVSLGAQLRAEMRGEPHIREEE